MAEYIERDRVVAIMVETAVVRKMRQLYAYNNGWRDALLLTKSGILEEMPAADVRPERHGRWSDNMVSYMDDFNGDIHIGFRCSECKAILNKTKYCGNCGAKMDGKDSESDE